MYVLINKYSFLAVHFFTFAKNSSININNMKFLIKIFKTSLLIIFLSSINFSAKAAGDYNRVYTGLSITKKFEFFKLTGSQYLWFKEDNLHLDFKEVAISHTLFVKNLNSSYNFRLWDKYSVNPGEKTPAATTTTYVHWNLSYFYQLGMIKLSLRNRIGYDFVQKNSAASQMIERIRFGISTSYKLSEECVLVPYTNHEFFYEQNRDDMTRMRTLVGMSIKTKHVTPNLFVGFEHEKENQMGTWDKDFVVGLFVTLSL